MGIANYNNDHLTFQLEFDESNVLTKFSYVNKKANENEVEAILQSHLGKYLHDLSSSLTKQKSLFNFPLMFVTREVLNLQGRTSSSATSKDDLLCRCFGKTVKEVLGDTTTQQLVGSGCGTCRPYVEELLPSFVVKESIVDPEFIPIQFHIAVNKYVKEISRRFDVGCELKRAKEKTLFLELFNIKSAMNPIQFKHALVTKIEEELGTKPHIILSIR
jgi:hypothetical protein